MIPEAREVQLSKKDGKVLEACCRSPVTLQRDLKRARIALLAAAGRSTRSIAKEVGSGRGSSAFGGIAMPLALKACWTNGGRAKQPIYTKATHNRQSDSAAVGQAGT
jgi:hypothetical protein